MTNKSFLKKRWCNACLSALLISAVCLTSLRAFSQDKKDPRKSDNVDDVIKISANLVNVDVMVKDNKGKAITDLKAEDFVLSENGVQQDIVFFESTLVSGAATSTGTLVTEPLPPPNLPRNIIGLVLDGQSTGGANLKHVREGITKYFRDHITASDSVALFAISGGLRLLQPFTQDKAKLIAAIEKADGVSSVSKSAETRGLNEAMAAIRDQLAGAPPGEITTPVGGSTAAQAMISQRVLEQYVQLRSALSTQQTRPVLAALAALAEGLRSIPGKKTLVMFSEGFVAPEALDWQVQSTIDIANRANVTIYIIDSGGLTGGAPKSGAVAPPSPLAGISAAVDVAQRRRAGAGESVFDISRQEGLNRQHDLLYRISEDTGGRFIKNTNDITGGLERIDTEIRSRYTLAYRSTDPDFDGSFRKVKITIRRADATVVARPGYYAIPPSQLVPFSPDEKRLLASFANMLARPALPLSLALNSFRYQEGYYIVPLSFEIPPAAVQFDRQGDKQRLHLEVLGVVRAEGDDKVLSRLGGIFDVGLSAQQYESILNDKIFYRQDIGLYAGSYIVELIVRDRLSGKVGAKREKLVLPVDSPDFWVTEEVLSRHVEPLRQKSRERDVISEGNVQIRPSPSREFRSTDNLIIFFKLYNAGLSGETRKPLVRVTVTLMKDGRQAMKPLDYQLTEIATEPVPHLTFAKYIKLHGLAAGRYTAVIESRDMVQQKVVKQEAGFVITQ